MKFNNLVDLSSKVMHKAFDRMADIGADPVLEAEDGDLTIFCEDGSATICLLAHRAQEGTMEIGLSLVAVPGIGKRWVAELVADCIVDVVNEAVNDGDDE